jgi:flagellar biosynthetic protein FlhB
MAEEDQDRTEPATPFKREEARRRGQVAKSLDTNSLFLLAAALISLTIWGKRFISDGADSFRRMLSSSRDLSLEPAYLRSWGNGVLHEALAALAPFFVLVLLAAVLSNVLQTGAVFSFHPLKPDPKRLNPVQGFKRIYSMKALFETLKSLIKLTLFATVAFSVITGMLPGIMNMLSASPKSYPPLLLDYAQSLAFRMVLAIMVIALLDLAYVRWDYAKKMRMSRREQKEEVKRREGDPHIRSKRRELQREAAKRTASLHRVPDADVLITNPTHLAIALKYERGRALAPRCLAKGAGDTAMRMKEMARRSGVAVVEQRALARALFEEVPIDALIPESLYEGVARVYADVAAGKRRESVVEVRA